MVVWTERPQFGYNAASSLPPAGSSDLRTIEAEHEVGWDDMAQLTDRVAADLADPVGPRRDQGDGVVDQVSREGDLATLVRRWMAAGTRPQDHGRREGPLRIAPVPDDPDEALVDPWGVPGAGDEPEVVPAPESYDAPASDVADADPGMQPRLPQRLTGPEAEHALRVAVLIDARRVSADVAAGLLGRLGERGSVNVCRAYADWSRAELGDWVGRMRREGLHSFHHFPDDDEQALVALAIDAVDIARDAAVDELVIAGDLTSALPLVHRLHAAGVRVVAVGAGHTPHDVRSACDEFVDTATLEGAQVRPAGRHRA